MVPSCGVQGGPQLDPQYCPERRGLDGRRVRKKKYMYMYIYIYVYIYIYTYIYTLSVGPRLLKLRLIKIIVMKWIFLWERKNVIKFIVMK